MKQVDIPFKRPDPVFADSEAPIDEAAYVIFGVPFDATSTHIAGSRGAPDAIRRESYNFETYLMDLEVDLVDIPMTDLGNLQVKNDELEQEEVLEKVRLVAGKVLDSGKFPFMMGGEHSLTEASVDAFMERYENRGGTVVMVDAHLDFRDDYMDNPHSHACVIRRIFEKWGKDSVAVIGVRSGCREEVIAAKESKLRYATSKEVRMASVFDVVESWEGAIGIRDRPVYLSIDMDGIDPSHAPGVGTPEPWGLTSWEVLQLMEELGRNVLAMDVMEVSPEVESVVTPSLAGKLIRQMIGLKEMKASNPTWIEHF